MVIDSHVHVWNLADRPQPWTDRLPPLQRSFELRDLEPELDSTDQVILVQTVAAFGESLELLQRAAGDPRIAGVVAWIDLTAADVDRQIRTLQKAPGGAALVGVRHQLQEEPDPNWLARKDVRAGLGAVGDAGLVFDLVVSPTALPLVARAVAEVPFTRFVLDHAGKPPIARRERSDGDPAGGCLHDWTGNISTLASLPNLAVKVSGLVTEADWARWTSAELTPVIAHVVDSFGPHRAMFGSDWPVCLLAADYRKVKQTLAPVLTALPQDASEAIWGGTAREWYRLGR